MIRKGRFDKPAAEIAQRYGESASFDCGLYRYDIAGSIAHAQALARAGTLTTAKCRKIENGLRAIEKQVESGKLKWDRSLEDVHINIEAALTKHIGTAAAGAKLQTARSRNDQIALDLRLYVKAEIAEISSRLRDLQRALLNLAERNVDVVLPGYTHLQRTQAITFSHYLLARIEAFKRDAQRLRECLTRTDVLPLVRRTRRIHYRARPREHRTRARFFARKPKQHRCSERSRFHLRIAFLSRHEWTASVAIERRFDHMVANLKRFSRFFERDVANVFDVRQSLSQRRAIGAPSPENVARQIEHWQAKLGRGD